MINKKILAAFVAEEQKMLSNLDKSDEILFQKLLDEINYHCGTTLKYLSELDNYFINESGKIIAKYITSFASQTIRAYLLHQLILDKVENCDYLILELYLCFKASDEYISLPGIPARADIYVRFDNAFKCLKSRRIASDLIKLSYNPRDVLYLPLTMRMLASWKIPELQNVFIKYLNESNITAEDVGINDSDTFFPPIKFIKRELRLISIDALKHYPTKETINVIQNFTNDSDSDISSLAKKTLKRLIKESK